MKKAILIFVSLISLTYTQDSLKRIESISTSKIAQSDDIFSKTEGKIDEARINLENRIKKVWDKIELSDAYNFVEYSANLKARRIISFENSKIVVEVIEDASEENQDRMLTSIREGITDSLTQKDGSGNEVLKNQVDDNTLKREAKNIKRSEYTAEDGKKKVKYTAIIPLKENNISERAKMYEDLILKYAKLRNIDADLIFAIVEAESQFNPLADNGIAYGLMQVVPTSAYDAAKTAFGEKRKVSKEELLNAEKNVNLGTALLSQYLYWDAYLGGYQENTYKHQLMATASYNCGAGRISRWIKSNPSYLNLNNEAFFEKLKLFVPNETKGYIVKVPKYRKNYSAYK